LIITQNGPIISK